MSNIAAFVGVSSGDDLIASVVSTNFDKIVAAVNSGAINSDNLGANCVLSSHISNGAVVAAKIGSNAINSTHIQFASTASGVPVVQIGSSPPANGVAMARCTATVAVASNQQTGSAACSWANAIDGNPGFTAEPTACMPAVTWGNSAATLPCSMVVLDKDSVAATCYFEFTSISTAITATVDMVAFGAK